MGNRWRRKSVAAAQVWSSGGERLAGRDGEVPGVRDELVEHQGIGDVGRQAGSSEEQQLRLRPVLGGDPPREVTHLVAASVVHRDGATPAAALGVLEAADECRERLHDMGAKCSDVQPLAGGGARVVGGIDALRCPRARRRPDIRTVRYTSGDGGSLGLLRPAPRPRDRCAGGLEAGHGPELTTAV